MPVSSHPYAMQAVPRALECRLALGYTALRNTKQLATGVLQAPIGTVSVAFCSMVGYSALLAWNEELAKGALTEYNKLALALLMETGATAQEPGRLHSTHEHMSSRDKPCSAHERAKEAKKP